MQSRYDDSEAEALVDRLVGAAPQALAGPKERRDLALRVYTSRLLGEAPDLVLHGGGNTSLKTQAHEYSGAPVDCLAVKGSGWDLATIEPSGFPLCRLEPLLELCRLTALSDADMVKALRGQMLDPSSPTPSVEALLHAYLPAKFVDHTHADAVLAVVDQPDAREHVERIWDGKALFVPYIMPGFVLLKRVVELMGNALPEGPIVLEKHGIFSWGDSARQSYGRMIDAVTAAEKHLEGRGATQIAVPEPLVSSGSGEAPDAQRRQLQRWFGPLARGAIVRALGGSPHLCVWQDDRATLSLAAHDAATSLTERGPLTPDHVIRTKQRPLYLGGVPSDDTDGTRAVLAAALERYRIEYEAYFARGAARHAESLKPLDPVPRILLVKGLGALCFGSSSKAARIVSDIYGHTSHVILRATQLGTYEPVSEADLFDVEYWSLEQAKLSQSKTSGRHAGKSVLVTGGARGIGLATARRFLEEGAHVTLIDRDEELATTARSLASQFGAQIHHQTADVTDPEAVTRAIDAIIDEFGGLDVVVSNAGSAPSGLLHSAEGDRALRQSLELNLLGHQNVARLSSELMLRQGIGGTLLFNASKSAFNPGPEFGPYAVPKAALVALMKQYAIDLGPHGIRAAAVNADRVRTNLFGHGVLEARAHARGVSPDEYFQLNLLSRETTADDVADAFSWLANAHATTGAVVPVDSGNPAAFPR